MQQSEHVCVCTWNEVVGMKGGLLLLNPGVRNGTRALANTTTTEPATTTPARNLLLPFPPSVIAHTVISEVFFFVGCGGVCHVSLSFLGR